MTASRLTATALFVLAACIAAISPSPVSIQAASAPAKPEALKSNLLIALPPEPSREEQRYTGVCYYIRPQETLTLLIKGEPPIPEGGFILIVGELGPGVEVSFAESAQIFTLGGWSMAFWIPGALPQEEVVFVRNSGETAAPACFKLAYEFPLEPEPRPEHKGGNDRSPSPLPSVQPRDTTPRPL